MNELHSGAAALATQRGRVVLIPAVCRAWWRDPSPLAGPRCIPGTHDNASTPNRCLPGEDTLKLGPVPRLVPVGTLLYGEKGY